MRKLTLLLILVAVLGLVLGSAPAPPSVAASAGLNCGTENDPTPTEPPETATATATAPSTATGTRTPAPSSTPVPPSLTPSPEPTRCTRQPVEVVLVIDASTSMLRFTSGGRTKLAAALDAAGLLVEMLEFERGDRAAVVAFNDETWTELMSSDEATVLAALDRIPSKVAEGTRLDLALAAGGLAHRLWPAQIGDAREVVVLLTDGLPNRVPFGPGTLYPSCGDQECTTVKVADSVKALRIEIVAIGLGDVLDRLMVLIPNDPGEYYYAPDGEDLADIYRQIAAGLVRCSGGLSESPDLEQTDRLAKSRESLVTYDPRFEGTDSCKNHECLDLPEWIVRTVAPSASQTGERILIGGDRAPTEDELDAVAKFNRGHVVDDPLLERAGYGVVWTPGRDNEQLDWRGSIDLQGSGVSAWREEIGELTGPAGDETPAQAGSAWPNDSYFYDQWALRGLHGLQWIGAWAGLTSLGQGGSGRIIAIIDNGLECAHPDLACWVGTHFNATEARELEHRSPWDTEVVVRGTGYDHGTFVGGIAAAHTGNGYGIAGISNAYALDVQGCIGGGCAEADVIRALQWIQDQKGRGLPIDAVNMSFAFKTSRLCPPNDDIRSVGILPFAAVGNSGDRTTGDRPQYPAACDSVVGVVHTQEDGTIDPQGQRAAVDLAAPGSEVRSLCARPHTTGVGSGSSFASPAAAASYVSIRAALEPALGALQAAEEALDVLYRTADPIEPATHPRGSADHDRDGYGRINLEAALAEVDDTWIGLNVPTPTPEGLPAATPTATPCSGSPEWCAAIGTATAMVVTSTPASTPTPSVPPTPNPVELTLTARSVPSETPTLAPPELTLTALAPEPTPDLTEIARILLTIVPPTDTPAPNWEATTTYRLCTEFRTWNAERCLSLPILTR